MAERWQITPTAFSPKETALITGLAVPQQRLWRHRGILAKREAGGTEFDPTGLAEIFLVTLLDREIGQDLQKAAANARHLAPAVVWHALGHQQAWHVTGNTESKMAFLDVLAGGNPNVEARLYELLHLHVNKEMLGAYALNLSDGWKFRDDLDDIGAGGTLGSIVLNISGLGLRLVRASRKPLFNAHDTRVVEDDNSSRSARPVAVRRPSGRKKASPRARNR